MRIPRELVECVQSDDQLLAATCAYSLISASSGFSGGLTEKHILHVNLQAHAVDELLAQH